LLAGNYPSTSKEQQLRALKGKMSALPTDEEKVDLDLSIQVFATGEWQFDRIIQRTGFIRTRLLVRAEPDISHLMDDLDTLTREKEKLMDEKIKAEDKYDAVNKKTQAEMVRWWFAVLR
jgi:hypothetical protein